MEEIHQYLITFQQKTHVLNNIPSPHTLPSPQTLLHTHLTQKLNLPAYTPLQIKLQEITQHITYVNASLKNSILGGKGGFGTLLKGQSKRAPNKVTLNFGACRDLNGRRLRFVNEELKLRALSQDTSKYNASGWYLDSVPNWSGVSTKAMRRNEMKRKRDMEEVNKKKEVEEREKERRRREDERKVMEYVNYEEGVRSEDMEACVLQGLKKQKKEQEEPVKDQESEDMPYLVTLSGEIQQINNTKILRSTSPFATACILLPHTTYTLYYELTLHSPGLLQIGWTQPHFKPQTPNDGIGDDSTSYGYDGSRQLTFRNGIERPYGKSWKRGDVLGTYYNPTTGVIGYYQNGVHLGEAFRGVKGVLYPGFSLDYDEGVEVLECLFCPKDCVPVQRILDGSMDQNAEEKTEETMEDKLDVTSEPKSDDTSKDKEDSKSEHKSETKEIIDLNNYNSPKELQSLGLEALKYNLQILGCKCGGNLEERAKRLFSLKGLEYRDYPKKALAKK